MRFKIRTVENYADIIVLRHPEGDASERAREVSRVPVVNAGAGAEEHPTQALTDLYTILLKKNLAYLKIYP
jgi:aspartate carbamoyltransferase catalytic subunit